MTMTTTAIVLTMASTTMTRPVISAGSVVAIINLGEVSRMLGSF